MVTLLKIVLGLTCAFPCSVPRGAIDTLVYIKFPLHTHLSFYEAYGKIVQLGLPAR